MLNVYFEQKLAIISVSPILLKVIKFCSLRNWATSLTKLKDLGLFFPL